jgi:hypothetical protein
MARRAKKTSPPTRFRVGDRIRFEFGGRVTAGKIIEDRGGIGVGGEQLLRVQVDVAMTDATMEFEIRAADVKSAA